MKKGTFKIKVRTDKGGWKWEEVKGFVSEHFGIHKGPYNFTITHLKTGLRMYSPELLRNARAIVKGFEKETFPVAWGSTTDSQAYKDNAPVAKNIINEVLYGSYTP